jgi:O-antigen/teichoic acid export membrane protein
MVIVVLINLFLNLPKVQEGYFPYIAINKNIVKNLGVYSVGNYISRLLLQITPLILPIFVVNELGPEMNAYFYITWTFVSISQVIPSSIFNSLFSEGSNQGKVSPSSIIKSIKFMLILLIPIIIATLIGAGWLLHLFGEQYSENGASVLRLMILSVIPWGLIYLYISIERINKESKWIIVVTAVSSILVLLFSYILMKNYGLIGLGMGYLVGQCIIGLLVGIHIWHKYFLNHQWGRIDAINP